MLLPERISARGINVISVRALVNQTGPFSLVQLGLVPSSTYRKASATRLSPHISSELGSTLLTGVYRGAQEQRSPSAALFRILINLMARVAVTSEKLIGP